MSNPKLKLVLYPDPILEKKTVPVTEFDESVQQTVSDMLTTMHASKGIGLAAPQVGLPYSILVFGGDPASGVHEGHVINPVLTSCSEETVESEEGCLSFPRLSAQVTRKARIEVAGKNAKGEDITIKADGLLAIVLQHEMDHLNGITFLHYLSRLKRDIIKKKMEKYRKALTYEAFKQLFLEEIKARQNAEK